MLMADALSRAPILDQAEASDASDPLICNISLGSKDKVLYSADSDYQTLVSLLKCCASSSELPLAFRNLQKCGIPFLLTLTRA